MKRLLILAAILGLLSSCTSKHVETKYEKEIKEFQKERVERLKKSIWLKLEGLYWLEEGENSFGSDKSNKVIFPENTPKFIGKFIVAKNEVSMEINDGVEVFIDSNKVNSVELKSDITDAKTEISMGSYHWFLVDREGRLGIRIYNDNSETLANFKGIDVYEPDSSFRFTADYVPYNPPKLITIPSVIGTESVDTCYGSIQFEKDGNRYSLDPIRSGQNYFIVFADMTNGKETYGAGRFLYVKGPVVDGKVILDFNKSYNPPCAFTKFATCPLPPKDNYLKLEIKAGEKNHGHH